MSLGQVTERCLYVAYRRVDVAYASEAKFVVAVVVSVVAVGVQVRCVGVVARLSRCRRNVVSAKQARRERLPLVLQRAQLLAKLAAGLADHFERLLAGAVRLLEVSAVAAAAAAACELVSSLARASYAPCTKTTYAASYSICAFE